jgi:hypothetical protein
MSIEEYTHNLKDSLYIFFTNIAGLYIHLEGSREYSKEEDDIFFENITDIIKSIPSINEYLYKEGLDKIVKKHKNNSNIMKFANISSIHNIMANETILEKDITEVLIELQTIKSPIYRNIYEILEYIKTLNERTEYILNVEEMCVYIRNTILGDYFTNILHAFNMNQIGKLHSYADLLQYNKKFLNGELPSTFYYYHRLVPDQSSEILIKLANKGFFTVDGQGNENTDSLKQREYSEGFIQEDNVQQLKECIERHPHLFGYIIDMKGNIILDKQNNNLRLPNGSPDTKYSVTLDKMNNTFYTFSGFQPSAHVFIEKSIDATGWWNDFKLFKETEGQIHTDIEQLYHYVVMDDRWVKSSSDDSLLEILLKCIPSSGGKRKTRKAKKARRKVQRKTRRR